MIKKINKHIEIVRSSQIHLSSMGQKSSDMIRDVLTQRYERVGVSIVNCTDDLEIVIATRPDLIFVGVKQLPFGDGTDAEATHVWVSECLDEHGLNYTGSTAAAIALDFDKPAAKRRVKSAGLKTAAYFRAGPGQYAPTKPLPLAYPLFIKPPNAGGGKGIGADSVARNFAAFAKKVQSVATSFRSDALVETFLPGREFSVAILGSADSNEFKVMPIELITTPNAHGDRILGHNIKLADTEHVIAVEEGIIRRAVTELAMDVFMALGARDFGRIDIRLDEQGTPHFLEANLIPGFSHHDFTSYFTSACWLNQTMDYEAMILHIVALGLSRDWDVDELMIEPIAPSPSITPILV